MTTLTAAQQEDAAYVASLAKDGEPHVLDLSDERQYRHIVTMHTLVGHTPDTRPGLHAGLAAAREVHAKDGPPTLDAADDDGFTSGVQLDALGFAEGTNQAAATGFAAFVDGAVQVNVGAQVTPTGQPQTVLATGANSDFGDGTLVGVDAVPVEGTTATQSITGTVFASYQLVENGPWASAQVSVDRSPGVMADPTVTQPVRKQTHLGNNRIIIAIGRGLGSKDDVDYWLAWDPNHAVYEVPFVGNVNFASAVPTPLVLGNNIQIYGKLARWTQSGKGGYRNLPTAEVQHIFSTLAASGANLSWNLPAPPDDHQPNDHGNTIHWGELNWTSGELDYLTIQIAVKLQGGQWAWATVQSSDTPDTNKLDGTANIYPLSFVYSCLAAGTPIRMAGGEDKAIELIERGDVIVAPDGSERKVMSTRIGRHRGTAIRLTTDEGAELLVSGNHTVLTPSGPKFAFELSAGDEVNGESGRTHKLSGADGGEFDGLLCNLSLTEAGDPTSEEQNAMLAAGFAVADYELQVAREYERRHDKDVILAQLDPESQKDFHNHLEEKAAAAAS